MALVEKGLFEVRDKVKIAIARLREFEPPEGYWLAFSGGKDSVCILDLAKKSGCKFTAHFSLTTVDPREVILFTRDNFPEVILEKPEMSMFEWILKKGFPPTRMIRFCCEKLKERGGSGRFVVTGIRWEESTKRRIRKMVEPCFKDKRKYYVNPIIDWTLEDVWEYHKKENLPHCKLYDHPDKFHRIGCVLCPMSTKRKKEQEIIRFPNFVKAYLHTFDKLVKLHPEFTWKTGKELFDWWVSGWDDRDKDNNEVLPFDN